MDWSAIFMPAIIFVLVRAIVLGNKACGAYLDAKYPKREDAEDWCPHNQSENENHGDR